MSNFIRSCYVLLIVSLLLTGCDERMELEISNWMETASEIPGEIWGQLNEDTRRVIAEGTKYVALTFDDGPRQETTEMLLDGLKERGVEATFFVTGTQIQCGSNGGLLKRMREEGHQIGNHTYSHQRLHGVQESTVIEEIRKNEVLLEDILGAGEYWLRPPYGMIDETGAALVETPMIYWTLDPEDWKLLDARKVADEVLKRIRPGDIVLLHDFYPTSVEAALLIVDRLQAEGYAFVTVQELFAICGVEPEDGVLYASPEKIRPIW